MRAITFKFFQESANYRISTNFESRNSYPLPPFSTVIGMVHYLCGFDSYHPMQLGIKGKADGRADNLQQGFVFGSLKFDPDRHKFSADGIGVNRTLFHVELLWNVNLTITIVPEDENDISIIYEALSNPREYPSLGRKEDIGSVTEVKLVDLDLHFFEKETTIDYPGWIPTTLKQGTRFNISKNYKLKQVRKNKVFREFEKIPVSISQGEVKVLPNTPVFKNTESNDYVFLF